MMRPPPPPSRRSDPTSTLRQPPHPSYHGPQRPSSGMYPYRPSSSGYAHPSISHTGQYRPPIISPTPRTDSRSHQHPFQALMSTQPMPETLGKEPEEEEEKEYESYEPSMPEAQPLPAFSQAYGQAASQSQSQAQSNVLVPESTHIPRRAPRGPPTVDLLGGFSPPTASIALPPPRQRTQSETVIPETRQESQSQSQEEVRPPNRVDTYRPEAMPRPMEVRRPTNIWQMSADGGGYGAPGQRSASVMGRPATAMAGGQQEGRNMSRAGGRGAAELFMAATQQQGGGGGKTNSEKIMDALAEWSTQILAEVAELKKDQKQVRDQVHAVQTSQKALATREEVVEEITAQLSPALHEFFLSLHAKIETSVKPIPDETAKLAGEKVRGIMMELKHIEASQRSQEDSQEKPAVKLLSHLISKLDAVTHISDFLRDCKDLPDALRDVAIYKQSIDVISAKLNAAPPPPPPAPVAPAIPQVDLRGLPEAIGQLNAQVHQLVTRPAHDPSEIGRVLNAITTLAMGLDRLPIHQPPVAPPAPPPAPNVEPPKLSQDVQQLQAKVDTLSADIGEVKALLAALKPATNLPPPPPAPAPQPTIDIADIVAQLKLALPALISQATPPTAAAPAQQPTIPHPPLVLPGPYPENEPMDDYSQLQPTEVGNSQSQTVQDYPTLVSSFRQPSALTQPSSDFGRASSDTFTQPSSRVEPSSTAPDPPTPFTAASTSAAPSQGHQTGGRISKDGVFEYRPPGASTVLGPAASTSAIPPSITNPTVFGTGTLGVDMFTEGIEDLDDFDDIFDRPLTKSAPSTLPKGKGKRAASNSGSTTSSGPSKKRVRTRTTAPLPSLSDKPRSHKKKLHTPSAASSIPDTELIPIDDSPPRRTPRPYSYAGGADTTLPILDPSNIPGGGVLKRSPRIVAARTNSTDPMYNSDLSPKAQRARPSQSKTVKQEKIERWDGTGKGGSESSPISIEDSDSLNKYLTRSKKPASPAVSSSDDSLNSLSLGDGKSRAGKAGGLKAREEVAEEMEAEQSLALPRDPAPIMGGTRYTRKKRLSDVSWGSDNSDGEL